MKIYSWKEIIEKTNEDIPELITIIKTKEQEITNLLIPGKNDSITEIEKMCSWIKENLGENIPLHFSAFHPDYKLTDSEPTPVRILEMAYKIGKEAGLRYVYLGNLSEEENTYCYSCDELLIRRTGFSVLENRLKDGRCQRCRTSLDGVALWIRTAPH